MRLTMRGMGWTPLILLFPSHPADHASARLIVLAESSLCANYRNPSA